ncbi:5-formyltetrahydrofolate cyclo-ligase [Luteithermobacter gelatinilyticus]|uniref:5-formyltetrahydrofolate cyclo-ligase n=1 Tax=Luteithermobacter gelatinilyticus TaxID=2582913 RepID=UPI001107396D|nr:5-formyltetrahydrofolate cyclo-ligase [Luteithermobacter gelatinilyticus]|tara:strand:- start:5308 stop:5880 length:573 start_codon:yes stop_codon:yes gene_type:complete
MNSKSELRKKLLEERRYLSQTQGVAAARDVAARLLLLPEMKNVEFVAGYAPLNSELDCLVALKVLHAAYYRVALPVVVRKDSPLMFREWDFERPLINGPYQTRHPDENYHEVIPDMMLVPLLAFDKVGHRLGYGGGYYDRTLAAYRAQRPAFLAVGLAFEGQRHDELFRDAHDEPLDMVITEKNVYRFTQ